MRAKNLLQLVSLGTLLLALSPVTSQGQLITNNDTSAILNVGSAWVGGAIPGTANTAVWDATVQVNTNVTLGGSLSWGGVQILNPGGPIIITNAPNTLTIGTSGIDMSQATNTLSFIGPIALNGSQTWKVTNGLSLFANSLVSGAGPLTINNGGNNIGTIALIGTNTYTGGTTINGGIVQVDSISSFGTGAVTNNGADLAFGGFTHSGIMANAVVVTGTTLLDMGGVNASFVLAGAWTGNSSATILVTNDTASGSTLTFGGNSGGNMANFTSSIVVADNISGTPSAGTIRFNNGGSDVNTGNAGMSVNLGGTNPGSPGSSVRLANRDPGTTSIGQLTGGTGTEAVGTSGGAGTTTWSIGALNTSFTFGGFFTNNAANEISALTKVGTGTMTLTGTNYTGTGTTTISAGTLQIGDGNADGTLLSGAIVDNASLAFNRPDVYNVSNNISGSGSVTIVGGGTNTYYGTNSSSLTISVGDLVLAASGKDSGPISVGSAGTFDVSQDPAFALNQVLSGSGTVAGLLAGASGTISPGSGTGASGTLTFVTGLTESNNVNNQFYVSTPGGTNDFINVTGTLTLSGTNNILLNTFSGGALVNGIYPLFGYTTLSGGITNLVVTAFGVTGTLTNITTTTPPQIAVIISPAARGSTNLTWKGDAGLNNWDTSSSNWFNGAISYSFQQGDSVLFNDTATPNTNVNLTATVLPASVTFSNTLHYTLSGSGDIDGPVSVILTNSGTVTILTTNTYTGSTIVGQGVLEVQNVGASGSSSGIGAATSNPTNLVFNGSTFKYSGPSAGTDRGMTLNSTGATMDVTNGSNLTLSGDITGSGALALTDTGTLTLVNPNDYSGGTVISNGILALGSNNANNNGSGGSGVGPATNAVTFDGGTLKLYGNGISTGANYNNFNNPLVVPTGQTGTLLMFPRGPVNTGGSSGLTCTLSGGGTLNLKVNYVRDALSGDWSAFTGLINVTNYTAAGGDEFRINNNFGYANASIYLNGSIIMDTALSTNMTVNIGSLGGASSVVIGPGNASEPAPTWSVGWNNASATFAGAIKDDNTAPGGHTSIIKVGTGTWGLYGGLVTNIDDSDPLFPTTIVAYTDLMSFTGNTTVSNGTLSLEGADALTNSTVITLASPSAVLDASSLGYNSNQLDSDEVTVTNEVLVTNSIVESLSGQTIAGIGTLNGFLLQDSGSTFNVGLPTGAFNVTSNANLSGAVNMNLSGNTSSELVSPSITINSATLVVTNVGLGLTNGVTFTLFNHPVTGFASVTLPPTDPTGTTNYVWANNLSSNGTITLTSGGLVAVTARPTIGFSHSGNSLSLSWSTSGFTLQMQTNAPNVGLSTNWVNVPGSTSITSTNITINPTNATFFQLVQ
jgi:autotransporter-associated beta strand protein